MSDNSGTHGHVRSSALWGTGNRGGDSRANALWGKGGRGFAALMLVLVATAAPLAGAGTTKKPAAAPSSVDAYLAGMAQNEPNALVRAIIQGSGGENDARDAFTAADEMDGNEDAEGLKRELGFVGAVAVTVKAKKIPLIAKRIDGLTITYDSTVKLSASSTQVWPTASGVRPFWSDTTITTARTPTIAIVDSGVDRNRADFDMGARVIREVTMTTLPNNSPGDGRGHGTFVAGIAAGNAPGLAGAAPQANIVSIDVMDDNGMARTSDVIAAAEWIFRNKAAYNIRVANFSLHSTIASNFTEDPLDRAVEKLWFSGVVVIAAAGNYGRADGPSGVPFAPGNDPFVITVGAVDLEGSTAPVRHDVPSWSAYGYTLDGFRKPEISAAGRYIIGPVPVNATLKTAKPDNVVTPTTMRLSGTSFAAPIVAGAAAQILARKPTWTPDMVKGALMLRARYVPEEGLTGAAGVGEINASRAADVVSPGNPNLALNQFVVPDPLGLNAPVFDAASWSDMARANASWDSVTWTDVTWSDASWSSVTWSDVTWSDVSWSDVTWSDVLAAESMAQEDNAEGEVANPVGDYFMTPEEEALAAADPELDIPASDEIPLP